jgi:hypothetical protein
MVMFWLLEELIVTSPKVSGFGVIVMPGSAGKGGSGGTIGITTQSVSIE